MCGIHLIVAKRNSNRDCEGALYRMMQASAYRGPDAASKLVWPSVRQQVYLGGQRLKITDLSDRANQPMVSSDERYALLYNGALYNFYELRNQLLAQGESFNTYSDTEVILKILIREGEAALKHFEGMFALAFYDRQEERLLVARDSFGIKPLYYAENEQYFLASSSSQSLASSGLISTALDPSQIDHYLYFRYPQKGHTVYQKIQSLSEGHCLIRSSLQSPVIQSYTGSRVEENRILPDKATVLSRAEELLKDAVLRHIATDVPTGLYLSGGVDSTLLLATMRALGIPPIPTFSLVNDAREKHFGTQDYRYAQRAARQFGSYHREVTVSLPVFEQHFEKFIQRMDQPVGDSGAMMTYLLSQEARNYVKVVLSGAGADELFGGYNRHLAYFRYLKHYDLFCMLARVGKKTGKFLPTGWPHPLRKSFRLLSKFTQSISDDPSATFLRFVGMPQLGPCPLPADQPVSTLAFVENNLAYALEHDQQHYLIEDVLQISDRASMAHSLELRVPYLDAPLVRFSQALPATGRLTYGRKWVLRDVLNQYGGHPFTQRTKEGFGLPFGHWLKNEASSVISRNLEDKQLPVYEFISHKQVNNLLKSHRSGYHDYSAELWSVMMLSAWLVSRDF